MIKKNIYWNISELSIFLIAIALWSSKLFIEWGTDFGIYYTGALYTSTIFNLLPEYKIYGEFFTHKGPVYYLFLKFIGNIIGWGHYQAVISLYLSLLVFYIPIYLIIKKNTRSFISSGFFLLLALLILVGQSTNSSIAFFQVGLLILSFKFLLLARKNNNLFYISFFFFILATLTRIDSVFFILPFLFYSYLNFKNDSQYILFIFLNFIIVPVFCFLIISVYFNFSIFDFLQHNISFNIWYSNFHNDGSFLYTIKKLFIRDGQFVLLSKSFILPIGLFLLASLFDKKVNLINFFKKNKINYLFNKNYMNIILCIIFISSIIALLNTFDKSYHLIIFSAPLLFIIINLSKPLLKPKYLQIIFIPFFLYMFIFESGVSYVFTHLIKNNYSCIKNPLCSTSHAVEYAKTVKLMKDSDMKEIHIIGGRGWLYLFSKKKPAQSVNDWWFVEGYKGSSNDLVKSHNQLLNMKTGYIFWIHNQLINSDEWDYTQKQQINILKSKQPQLVKDILGKSEYIENQGMYSMFKIK